MYAKGRRHCHLGLEMNKFNWTSAICISWELSYILSILFGKFFPETFLHVLNNLKLEYSMQIIFYKAGVWRISSLFFNLFILDLQALFWNEGKDWFQATDLFNVFDFDLVIWASLVAQMVKNLPAMQETLVWSLGQEDPLEKGMATHSSILAWKILWTEEPGGLLCNPWGCEELDITTRKDVAVLPKWECTLKTLKASSFLILCITFYCILV